MKTATSEQETRSNGTSQNGSGVPQWLEALRVKKGRWYSSSKARPERLMQISLTADAQRIHACLELGSMAYQREDAVCTVKDGSESGKQVWLTPGKIAKLTEISKEHVLRALKELEYYGLAERFLIHPARGEVKGNIGVRSWALPRPLQEEEKREPRAAPFLELGAEYKALARFINRFKLDLDPDKWGDSRGSNLEAALAAVAKVEEAEKEAVALLKGYGAQERLYKVESNGNKHESNGAGRQASTVVEEPPDLPAGHPQVSESNGNATPRTPTLEEIRALSAVQQLEAEAHDTVGPKLGERIIAALGTTPLKSFNERVLKKRARGPVPLGLLPNLAGDTTRSEVEGKLHAQKAAQDGKEHMQAQEDRTVAAALRDWVTIPAADRQAFRDWRPDVPWPSE